MPVRHAVSSDCGPVSLPSVRPDGTRGRGAERMPRHDEQQLDAGFHEHDAGTVNEHDARADDKHDARADNDARADHDARAHDDAKAAAIEALLQ